MYTCSSSIYNTCTWNRLYWMVISNVWSARNAKHKIKCPEWGALETRRDGDLFHIYTMCSIWFVFWIEINLDSNASHQHQQQQQQIDALLWNRVVALPSFARYYVHTDTLLNIIFHPFFVLYRRLLPQLKANVDVTHRNGQTRRIPLQFSPFQTPRAKTRTQIQKSVSGACVCVSVFVSVILLYA